MWFICWIVVVMGVVSAYWLPVFALWLQRADQAVALASRLWCVGWFCLGNALIYWQLGASGQAILALIGLWWLLVVAWIDHRFGLIPNRLTYPAAVLLWLLRGLTGEWAYWIAALVGGGALFLLAVLTKGMGVGDAKLFAVAGLCVGWPYIWLVLWLATVSGTLYIVWRYVRRQPLGRKTSFPFGPHLAVGVVLAYLYGAQWERFMMVWFYPF
jgi:prepilin signal peptidase PulO-like enzyme (type II secretory pathway)